MWQNQGKTQVTNRNLPIQRDTIRESTDWSPGTELGTISAVKLNMEVAATQANHEISCFLLDSSKPLWQGELRDCDVLLRANPLVEFGIEITHSDGTVIIPSSLKTPEGTQGSHEDDKVKILQLSMEKTVHLMSQQSKWVKATVDVPEDTKFVGVMSPKANTLGGKTCDFLENLYFVEW